MPVSGFELWFGTDCQELDGVWLLRPYAAKWPLFSTCPSPSGRLAPRSTWVSQYLPLSVAVDQQIKTKQKPPYAFSGEMGGGHPADPFSECERSGVTASLLGCVSTHFYVGCTMV